MKITKKILTALILTVVVLSLSVSAFAETGSFLISPSANRAPEIVSSDSEDHDCDKELIITAYADRDSLPEEEKEAIEKAYVKVSGAKNLTALCGALKKLAEEKGIPTSNLSVSDLFDIRDEHDDVEDCVFDIVLKAETLENFVGLLHYTNGKWELIENAVVEEIDGEMHLKFSTKGLSPFAIVVDTGAYIEPSNGNNLLVAILAFVAIAEAAALIAILIKYLLGKKTA